MHLFSRTLYIHVVYMQDPEEEIECLSRGAAFAGGLKVIKKVTSRQHLP